VAVPRPRVAAAAFRGDETERRMRHDIRPGLRRQRARGLVHADDVLAPIVGKPADPLNDSRSDDARARVPAVQSERARRSGSVLRSRISPGSGP
jgi:hypothetical protein